MKRFASASSVAAGRGFRRPSSNAWRADANVTLVAVADTFRDRANSCLTNLRGIDAVRKQSRCSERSHLHWDWRRISK